MASAKLASRSISGVIRRQPRWSLALAVILGLLVLLVAIVTLWGSKASAVDDVIVGVADVNGGFLNGIVAINQSSGAIAGQLAADLPQLAGCTGSQNRAYLGDMLIDAPRHQVLVGVRACNGGNLPINQSIARFDVTSQRFTGFWSGPGAGTRLLAHPSLNIVAALSASGTTVQILNATSGAQLKAVTTSEPVTRWGIGPDDSLMMATASGRILRVDPSSGTLAELSHGTITFPTLPAAPDSIRLVQAAGASFALGYQGSTPVLASISPQGQVTPYALESTPTSLTTNPDKTHVFVVTGCPSGSGCITNPYRMYAFATQAKQFQEAGGSNYFPLQTSPSTIRFSDDSERIYFDGILVGSSGVGQRFVFVLDSQSTQPVAARIAIPAAQWDVATVALPSAGTTPVSVPTDIPSGGGVGPGNGVAIPLDEIERLLGISLADLDFSKITDDQIRAYGYDPATVRRWVAQSKLQATRASGNNTAISSCPGNDAGAQIRAQIESQIGIPLSQIDLTKVTDDQIRAYGFDPATARAALAAATADSCANQFTQEAFVMPAGSSTTVVGGQVTNLTAQTSFDFWRGGWLITLRWQAPGGAHNFHVYGRDNARHQLESRLATVGPLERSASFGGFGSIALKALHNQTYVFGVVPETAEHSLGVPTAVKVKVQCWVVWCQATAMK